MGVNKEHLDKIMETLNRVLYIIPSDIYIIKYHGITTIELSSEKAIETINNFPHYLQEYIYESNGIKKIDFDKLMSFTEVEDFAKEYDFTYTLIKI